MANWYTSREALKRAASIHGADLNLRIDRIIEGASRELDRSTRRFFLPRTETRLYMWPRRSATLAYQLWLDQDLLSVTTLQTQAQNSSPTTISSSDYFLEPANSTPYNRIEIDLSSTSAFESGDTPQRSISVLGSWGFSNDTRSTGTVVSGLAGSASATTMVCSDASTIDVGDTLLIESEQLFVSDRDFAALDSILLDGALTASQAGTTVTVDGSHGIVANEVIRVESERMLVLSVSGNDLTVLRAFDGSTLASHSNNTAVHINRTLTVERGINGTTAATHSNSTAASKYEPPFDVTSAVLAQAIAYYHQEGAGWGRTIGAGEGAREFEGRDLASRWWTTIKKYRRGRDAVAV